MKGASATSPGIRLGMQYKWSDHLNVGLSYGSSVNLDLKNDHLASNQTAIGNGYVHSRHAELSELKLPQKLAAGIAWQAKPDWLISTKVLWLEWSSARKSQTLIARDPDNAAAPAQIRTTTALN